MYDPDFISCRLFDKLLIPTSLRVRQQTVGVGVGVGRLRRDSQSSSKQTRDLHAMSRFAGEGGVEVSRNKTMERAPLGKASVSASHGAR